MTRWGYADVMDMDAEELAWWVDQAMDFEERKAELRKAADGISR